MVAPRHESTRTLIDDYLAEQSRLQTPVAHFAAAHAAGLPSAPAARHAAPIPLTLPQVGEQYAFEVDLDACTGCKSCVAACHALNGLEETETWRDVGLLVAPTRSQPYSQTVTTACHHCEEPACLHGCPVLAYEKDPITGIVRHLDDQCIGCSYCILKCPYDVPKFSDRLGIVRKCDMCHDRLAHGEAPACVQSCPTQAIRIVTVTTTVEAPPANFLPAAPDPGYTRPTTRYVSRRPVPPQAVAADAETLRMQPAHWPLVGLLVLMPMAVGCGVVSELVSLRTPALAVLGWIAGAAGLGCSVLHLGQPLRAWRVFLGLRQSWLSREAIVFGLWFSLASVDAATRLGWRPLGSGPFLSGLPTITALVGTLGLFCSVMIYADTRRQFWRFSSTAPRFFGSAAVLGIAGALCTAGAPHQLGFALAAATVSKLLLEARALAAPGESGEAPTPDRKTAQLLFGTLRHVQEVRAVCALLGGVVVPLLIAVEAAPAVLAWPGLALCLGGELAERYLFFRAVDAPKMPGLPTTGARGEIRRT